MQCTAESALAQLPQTLSKAYDVGIHDIQDRIRLKLICWSSSELLARAGCINRSPDFAAKWRCKL